MYSAPTTRDRIKPTTLMNVEVTREGVEEDPLPVSLQLRCRLVLLLGSQTSWCPLRPVSRRFLGRMGDKRVGFTTDYIKVVKGHG